MPWRISLDLSICVEEIGEPKSYGKKRCIVIHRQYQRRCMSQGYKMENNFLNVCCTCDVINVLWGAWSLVPNTLVVFWFLVVSSGA